LLVNDQDIYRIKKVCDEVHEKDSDLDSKLTIKHLLRDDLILLEKKAMTKEALLRKACGILLEQGYVKEGFFESVMHREEISSSVLGGGMAVPHGVSEYVEHPAVVVIRSDDSIEWGEGAVDVIFLLALNFEDIESTRAFFAAFYEMTMQKESGYMQEDGS
jgi:mannitol/fructose-specific phosphotransferase system IIA component (Ntr-type)